ncbi:MAG: hypothetical protein KF715_08650 [Candidatus Didemnitutus sp.]|nr:hypothetical protein [Candidatus Didemnitutus sp.]
MHGAFTPLFTSLDQLASKSASVADVNKILPGLVNNELKFYRVAIDTAEESRPGTVAPCNRHPLLNPILFIQC